MNHQHSSNQPPLSYADAVKKGVAYPNTAETKQQQQQQQQRLFSQSHNAGVNTNTAVSIVPTQPISLFLPLQNSNMLVMLPRCVFETLSTFLLLNDIQAIAQCSKRLHAIVNQLQSWECQHCQQHAISTPQPWPLFCKKCPLLLCFECTNTCTECDELTCFCDLGFCDRCHSSYCNNCNQVELCGDCRLTSCLQCTPGTDFCKECNVFYCVDCRHVGHCRGCGQSSCIPCQRASGNVVVNCSQCDTTFCTRCTDFAPCDHCHSPVCRCCFETGFPYCSEECRELRLVELFRGYRAQAALGSEDVEE